MRVETLEAERLRVPVLLRRFRYCHVALPFRSLSAEIRPSPVAESKTLAKREPETSEVAAIEPSVC